MIGSTRSSFRGPYSSTPDGTLNQAQMAHGMACCDWRRQDANDLKHVAMCLTHKALTTFFHHLWFVSVVSFATDLMLRLIMTNSNYVSQGHARTAAWNGVRSSYLAELDKRFRAATQPYYGLWMPRAWAWKVEKPGGFENALLRSSSYIVRGSGSCTDTYIPSRLSALIQC